MDINVNVSHNVELKQSESIEKRFTGLDSSPNAKDSHSNDTGQISANSVTQTSSPTQTLVHPEEMDSILNIHNNSSSSNMELLDAATSNDTSPTADEEDEEEDGEDMEEGAEYVVHHSGGSDNNNGMMDSSSMMSNMGHSFDDIQFFPSSHHRSLRLQPQFQFHQEQLNDPNSYLASNLSCFDASGLVSLSGSGSVNSFSLMSDSVSGDINNAFSESPFVFPDNVMEYGEPQFFPGNCVGYLETILEEDDEEYEEEEGCSGRHWWTADSDTDTDSVIRVDNNGQTQQQQQKSTTQGNPGATTSGEKDVVKPHFRSSASSKPFELEDLHLFDQLDHAFEETLRDSRKRSGLPYGHQLQSVEQPVEFNKGKHLLHQNQLAALHASAITAGQTSNGAKCQKTGGSNNNDKTATGHHVFIESPNNESKDEMTTKGLKMLTQENVKAHSDENSKIIYEVGEEKEQSSKKLGNAESRETFGSSLSPSSSDSEAPAEVAEEDFFYSSPGSEEEECRSQEETESEESCSSDDSEKNGVVLAEFSLGSASNTGGGNGGFNTSSGGMMFGSSRNRRSFESPSRLKSFRSFDSLNCLAGTELLFSKPDTFPSIHHIKEVSEPGSESESSNEVSAADDRGLIPEEDEEEEETNALAHREGTRSLPSQHSNSSVGFPGPILNQISIKTSASSSTSTVSSSASGSGLRSTENLSEDSGIGNDGISSTAASTPGAFIEETNVIMSNNGKQNEDCNKKPSVSPSTSIKANATAESDAALLAPDSARDYISRAEFALNPFVYSSLSSSEPDSSISSAPSLGCNTNTGLLTQNQLPSSSSRSHPKAELGNSSSFKRNDDESLVENGNHIVDGRSGSSSSSRENSVRENHSESNGKTHEFVLDSNSTESGEQKQEQARNYKTNERIGMKNGEELRESNVNKIGASESPSSGGSSSNNNNTGLSHKPTRSPSPTGDFVGKHADSVSGTESFSESGESTHAPHFNIIMTNDIIPLESVSLHPQLNPPVQTISSLQSTSSKSHPALSGPTTPDSSQDKEELANNNGVSPQSVGQPTAATANSSLAAELIHVPNVNQRWASADELANTSSSSTPTEQSVVETTINSCFASDNAATTMNKIKNAESSHVANTLGKQRDDASITTANSVQMCNTNMMMDGSTQRSSENKVKQNEHHHHHHEVDNVISFVTTSTSSSMASLQPHSTTQHQTQPDDTENGMLCISSFPCSKPSSHHPQDQENDECFKDSNSITAKDPSCSQGLGLNMSKDDWDDDDERKHAPLQLSSSLLSSAVDNSFSNCSREQDPQNHDYSSSSSSDELNENSHQPRFHRQRSDSESEYEAAESAVERNNVDMAYDIIVNSPSKKALAQTSSSPPESSSSISSMSDVVGAIAGSASTTSSSFNAKPSSLEHEQRSRSTAAAAPPAEYHSQSQNEMNTNKCNRESGPVSTLSSLINIHHNDMHSSCKHEDNMRNDKRLPLFESSIDDYDDDDDDDADTIAALVTTDSPITKNMEATSNVIHANNVIAGTSVTLCAHKSSSCTTRHEDGLVNGKQLLQSTKEQTSSSSLQQAEARVIENTSLALHHHHQPNYHQQHNQQNQNSDELTSASLPQSHFHVASNRQSVDAEHREPIVGNKNKNFSSNGETQHKHQHRAHQQDQHNNVLRSVTLDDSTSADVAHNNLQKRSNTNNTSQPSAGIALKSNNTNSAPKEHHSSTAPSFHQQRNGPSETHYSSNSARNPAPNNGGHQQGLLFVTENGANQHEKGSNKLVTAEPYCPNQIGVAEVKKFLTGYVGPKECESFSGPVEPPSSSSSSSCDVKESFENNNNKQEGEDAEYCNSQSVNRIAQSASNSSSSIAIARAPTTAHQVNTTGKERVILGDSNFGFFGCSSATRTPASHVSNRGVYESHESVVPSAYASCSNVLPQVNLDLHSISASESGFSPGYGFPCSLPIKGKDTHLQDALPEQPILKENNTLFPSSTEASSSTTNSFIKRSVSPSSTKAAHESSKEVNKGGIIRRDHQQQSKDHKQQQQYQQKHLHLEDIGLYAAIDKFSVPLGAIKAAVVAVAPTIPSYIVGPSHTHPSNALTAEKSATKRQSPLAQASGAYQTAVEANGNLSTGLATTGNSNTGGGRVVLAAARGENKETLDKATHPASVPDILILKQSGCTRSDSETQVERKLAKRGVMELETSAAGIANSGGSSDISAKGRNPATHNTIQRIDSSNITESISSSTEMFRSDSPAGSSSAPSGIPLKTKTYGARNEVEVVVVSSRTPSPAPGGFVSTSSSSFSSSRKLPSSPSSGQEWNEQSSSSSSSTPHAAHYHGQAVELYENAARESSIPPPPSTPPVATKATRSRVHFSPVVSEISWRESYIDQSSECSGSTDDLLAKLENLDAEESPPLTSRTLGDNGNGTSASANLRKAGAAAAAAAVVNSATSHSGDIKYASGDVSDVASSAVRPLQVYDIQMSTRAESPSSSGSARGLPSFAKGPILVEKVEMTSSPLHDREEEVDRLLLGESHSTRKLVDDDVVDNDSERVTDLVDFRNNSGSNKNGSSNGNFSDQNNGTLGLYEDVEVQIEPTTKTHGSTTLSMVPDLLSQCENTNHTLTHIDVKIEETVPSLHNKSIVLNIGTPDRDIEQQQPQKTRSKSQSPQPQEPSPEPKQILPKIFAEDNKNDNKRNSSSSLSSTSKEKKKSSKGFTIQGLGSAGKKSEKDNGNNGKDATTTTTTNPNVNGTNNYGASKSAVAVATGDDKPEKDIVAEAAKENKKSSKPGFFERLSKIRLSSGSKSKKQKVHPKADEIHQEADTSGAPTVISTTTNFGGPTPLRSANSFNVNGNSNKSNNGGANTSSLTTNHSGTAVQPILKKSTASSSTIPPVGPHYNGSEMGVMGDSENEPDEATQAFENILEEIAGLKSIQLRQEKNSNSSIEKSPTSQQVRSFAKRKQFYTNAGSPSPPVSPNIRSYSDFDSKLNKFKEDTSRTLDAISKSHPDLEIIEDAVKQRQKSLSPEPSKHVEHSRAMSATLPKQSSSSASEAMQNSEREWYRLLKSAAEKYSYRGPRDDQYSRESALAHKTGIVETDLDTGASREMLDEDMLQLDCIVPCYTVSTSEIPTSAAAASTTVSIVTSTGSPATAAKTRSLTNLSTRLPLSIAPSQFEESTGDLSDSEERAKSLEFLLDENHKSSSVPPENKLRLETRQLSEHELRIQRSLQRLNVPEWYKQHEALSSNASSGVSSQYTAAAPNITKRSDYGSSSGLAGGWTGLSTYKAPSMSSLQSNGGRSSGTLKSNFVRGRPATMSVTRTSKESLLTGSANHSPSAFERSSFTYGMPFTMTRFGQGRLSTHSGSVSPPSTPDSTVKTSSYVKKPYLGWRSQERLNAAAASGVSTPGAATTGTPKLSVYLPPAERLAADLLASRAKSPHPPVRPPVGDRPPLPKAPPRSEKTVLSKNHTGHDELIETAGAHCSSPAMSKQSSSFAVVTKIPNQTNDSHHPSQEFSSQNSQSHKSQSTKVSPDVHDSIRQVTTAISHYINRGQEGQSQQKVKPKTGKKQAIWIESSFVGQKPPSK